MLTEKDRRAILNMNSENPTMQQYIQRVFEEAPMLTNSVHIEGIANEWYNAVENERWKNLSFESAVKRYERTYEKEAKLAKKFGVEMPKLEMDLSKPEQEYTVNEELTATAIEAQKKLGNLVGALKDLSETGSLFNIEDEVERFYGTVLNEETVKKTQRMVELLNIIGLGSLDINVEPFTPNPRMPSAILAMNVKNLNTLDGTTMAAFRELTSIADDMTIVPKEDRVCRIAFSVNDLWKEHRTMSIEEAMEYFGSDLDE